MKGIFKKTFILFLVCALFLTGGIFNAAMADDGEGEHECKHTVTYSYTGTVPTGAPGLPTEQSYHYLHFVTIADPPSLEGYTFQGWNVSGATTHEYCFKGKQIHYFYMPHNDVQITGNWTANTPPPTATPPETTTPTPPPESPKPTPNPFAVIYAVDYMYTGNVPATAPALPGVNYFYVGTTAQVAPMPQLPGYVFSGWKTTDVTVVNGAFAMPFKNVTFSGYWVAGSTAGVPNTGGDSIVLIPAVLLLSGIALMAVILGRKTKKSEK